MNAEAVRLKRPLVDHLNCDEIERIVQLIRAETWPDGWNGDEPVATELQNVYRADGTIQPLLFGLEEETQ